MADLGVRRRRRPWREGAVKEVLVARIARRPDAVNLVSRRLAALALEDYVVACIPVVPALEYADVDPLSAVVDVEDSGAMPVKSDVMRMRLRTGDCRQAAWLSRLRAFFEYREHGFQGLGSEVFGAAV